MSYYITTIATLISFTSVVHESFYYILNKYTNTPYKSAQFFAMR